MERDYDDFVLPFKKHHNIQAMYDGYYNDATYGDCEPSNVGHRTDAHYTHPEQYIDGVLVSIEFYQYREEQTEYDLIQLAQQQKQQRERERQRQERERQRAEAQNRRNRNAYGWNWVNYAPSTQQQESDELQRAIAASLEQQYLIPNYEDVERGEGEQEEEEKDDSKEEEKEKEKEEELVPERVYVMKDIHHATATVSVWGHNAKKYFPSYVTQHKAKNELHTAIASKAWHTYRNNVLCHIHFREHHLWRTAEWKIMENSDRAQRNKLQLMHVLDSCAPYLYPVYHVLFEYMGYSYLKVSNVKVMLLIAAAKSGRSSSLKESGIEYVDPLPYDERRRYVDYTDDVRSYVPSYIYYKRNSRNQFYNFGEYDKKDWQLLTYYASKSSKVATK